MKTVSMIETFDGKLHSSADDASDHLDKLQDEIVTKLANKIVSGNFKFTETRTILLESIDSMRGLVKIADDRRLFR